MKFKKFNFGIKFAFIFLFFLCVILISLMFGRFYLSPATIFKVIGSKLFHISENIPKYAITIIWQVRLPRILAGILIGAALAISGVVYQGVFNNPLVSPFILGIAPAAGFGAAIGIILSSNLILISGSSFIFAIISVILTVLVSRINRGYSKSNLILAGIIIGSLFSSLLSLLKYVADPYEKLPGIVYWLMGSLAGISYKQLVILAPLIISGAIILYFLGWKINILSLGDEEAKVLGENPEIIRIIVIIIASLITSISISFTGIIGWIGLVVPHLGRMIVGPDHKKLILVSFIFGGIFLLLIDNISRTLTSTEIPIGILTAIVGAPFFIIIFRKSKTGWM